MRRVLLVALKRPPARRYVNETRASPELFGFTDATSNAGASALSCWGRARTSTSMSPVTVVTATSVTTGSVRIISSTLLLPVSSGPERHDGAPGHRLIGSDAP